MDEWSELEAKARAATPGPWRDSRDTLGMPSVYRCDDAIAEVYGTESTPGYDNAAFIASASPNVILALIAQLREARGLVEIATEAARTEQDAVRAVTELAKSLETERDALESEVTTQRARAKRAELEAERLRAAMPSESVLDACALLAEARPSSSAAIVEVWLQRVEAMRNGGGHG